MQGILDNPDAAYAKLREMGKGLFGPDGGGLGGLIGGLRRPATRRQLPADRPAATAAPGGDRLGGNLGQALGNLFQQPRPRRQPEHPSARRLASPAGRIVAGAGASAPGLAAAPAQPRRKTTRRRRTASR